MEKLTEKEYKVTNSYNLWKTIILSQIDKYNEELQEYSLITSMELLFPDCFKKCKTYMIAPVAIVNHTSIYAASKNMSGEQECIDFINNNQNVIPYMFYRQGDNYIFRGYIGNIDI